MSLSWSILHLNFKIIFTFHSQPVTVDNLIEKNFYLVTFLVSCGSHNNAGIAVQYEHI